MSDFTATPIEQRLVESAVAWLAAAAATEDYAALFACVLRERDDTGELTPKAETPKRLRLIVTVLDEGRAVKLTPIRNLLLRLTIRGNAKTEGGDGEGMKPVAAALERLLDDTNVKEALDSAELGVRVMLAMRRAGCGFQREGMIRRQIYELECKAVAAERTA